MILYVVYHDFGGTHSTVIAAAIHLNWLPLDVVPSVDDILKIPLFDRLEKKDQGRLIYHGRDEYDNDVYTICRRNVPDLVSHALESVFEMAARDPREVLCVDTAPATNAWMQVGGAGSRRLGFVTLGRPMVAYGILRAYPKIVAIVHRTKCKVAP